MIALDIIVAINVGWLAHIVVSEIQFRRSVEGKYVGHSVDARCDVDQ